MFQSWRIKLREADTAYRQGRYDDAIRMLADEEVQGTLPGRRLALKLTNSLLKRGRRRLVAADMAQAWKDYDRIVRVAGECDRALALRDELLDAVLADCRELMASSDYQRCLTKLDDLTRRGFHHESVVSLRETIRRVRSADHLAQHGKFAEAIEQLKLADGCGVESTQLATRLADYQSRQGVGRELSEKLHRAMIKREWTTAVQHAEQLLEIAPLSSLARDARKQAWAQAGTRVSHVAVAEPRSDAGNHDNTDRAKLGEANMDGRNENKFNEEAGEPDDWVPVPDLGRFFLWVDGVGGYLVCPADTITVGQALPMAGVDVPILGDVSRRHVSIRRSGEGYVVDPIAKTRLNGNLIDRPTLLKGGDRLRMSAVEIRFRQPHALSSTACLDFVSRHGTQPSADGVILLADSCVLGPRKENHVVCRDWEHDVVLFRQKERLYCRAVTSFEIDGQLSDGQGTLDLASHVRGDDFSISLEPMQT
mgnify:CR=1 FL=1